MGNCETFPDCYSDIKTYSPVWLDGDLKLPPLQAENDTVTISGFSGGSSMTVLMSVLYPERFAGFGPMHGGIPFGGRGNSVTVADSIALVAEREAAGLAGPVAALQNKPVWIFSGAEDSVVPPARQEQ